MLSTHLTKGVKIIGLSDKLTGPTESELSDSAGKEVSRAIVNGSWTYAWNMFSANTVTFYNDNTGANKVKILPYVPGAINYVESQGQAVISGEFNGCIMAVYKYPDGAQRVCHVDTDTSRPGSKANWEKWVGDGTIEVAAQHSTKGQVLDKVLGKKQAKQLEWSQRLKILCVAETDGAIRHVFVYKQDDGSYLVK